MLGVLAGKEKLGEEPLAGKSTLNRLELTDKKSDREKERYKKIFCDARGDMENRIKEQLSLFADRVSTESLRANQVRMYFSAVAYTLLQALRRLVYVGDTAVGWTFGSVLAVNSSGNSRRLLAI